MFRMLHEAGASYGAIARRPGSLGAGDCGIFTDGDHRDRASRSPQTTDGDRLRPECTHRVHPRSAPMEWPATHANLGVTRRKLPTGDRGGNLTTAGRPRCRAIAVTGCRQVRSWRTSAKSPTAVNARATAPAGGRGRPPQAIPRQPSRGRAERSERASRRWPNAQLQRWPWRTARRVRAAERDPLHVGPRRSSAPTSRV